MGMAVDLVRAILAESCSSDKAALAILERALEVEVDPLDFLARRLGLGDETVLRRAAAWAGAGYAPLLPEGLKEEAVAVARLVDIRAVSIRGPQGSDRYLAPRFMDVIRARERPTASRDALRLWFMPHARLLEGIARAISGRLLDDARQGLSRSWPQACAQLELGKAARVRFAIQLLTLVLLVAVVPMFFPAEAFPLVALALVLPALFRFDAAFSARPPPAPAQRVPDDRLPIYSVLIPLRDEANMVPLLHAAMSALDYPPERLDIVFVVEARSAETVAAVRRLEGDARVLILAVPDALPRTKPKALDFALPFVRGDFVVVYDAEDVPDRDQLRLAAAQFAAEPDIVCLQAELRIDNDGENRLTALFAGEYAGLFGHLLPALARWGLPVPLGGTSNHFRVETLRALGAWDAFNVTEDADLGVRLARRGLETRTLQSQTREEAPPHIRDWLAQRRRWMKGWMQTFIIHNRRPMQLCRELGWRAFLGFELLFGTMIAAPLMHCAFGIVVLGRGLTGTLRFDDGWVLAYLAVAGTGYGAAFALSVCGLSRLRRWRLLAIQLLLPLYWILHAIATLDALVELLRAPYFWAKTTHGLTAMQRTGVAVSPTPPQDGSAHSGQRVAIE